MIIQLIIFGLGNGYDIVAFSLGSMDSSYNKDQPIIYSSMNDHLVKFGASFIVGTLATAGLVRLIQWAPIPSYIKFVLAVVVPVPSIAIALVLLYYGPEAQAGATAISGLGPPGALLKMFLYGCLATFGYAGGAALWRMFQPLEDRGDASGDDHA